MIPTQENVPAPTSSTFWTAVIAVWLVLFAVAATLALALAIWRLLEAF